ncbi:EGF-like domain-containing protein 2 [Babylonia areolata]|uniref:EGF-like domain-containing protein 2 n=1 Tax=Babylonia areolata TaxID=304850 RepID=UPI003FD0D8DC
MASPNLFQILATVFLLMDLVAVGYAAFNCSRPGVGCMNGGLCQVDGNCECLGTTYSGFDCSQETQFIMHGNCLRDNPCRNGGTCYDDMVSISGQRRSQCYCPVEYYGEFCERPSVQSECYRDQMIINIYPGDRFSGNVFLQGAPGVSCTVPPVHSQVSFTLDPVRSKWRGFATELPYNGTDCGARPNISRTATEIIYTYDVTVQYDITGRNPHLDEIISISCPRPNVPAGAIGPTAVLFSVSDGTGAMVNRPKLGSLVTISFSVDPTSIFTDILIQSCSVSNSHNTRSKLVVKDSCPLPPFAKALEKRGPTHVLTLITHVLGRDPKMNFDCAVKVCTVSDTSCQKQPYCPVTHAPMHGGSHMGGSMHGGSHMGDPHALGGVGGGGGGGPMGYDPHAAAGAGGGATPGGGMPPASDLLGILSGMGGAGGGGGGGAAAALDSLLAAGGAPTGGGGGGGSASATLQELMSGLGGGATGSYSGATGGGVSGGGGAAGGGGGGGDFMSTLMSMTGTGGSSLGSNVMNDLLFGGPTGGAMDHTSMMMGAGGGGGGMVMPGAGGMGMTYGRRRRRDVTEGEDGTPSQQDLVYVGGNL